MAPHDINNFLHDLFMKTLPGAVGSVVFYLTELGPVAWLTMGWVTIQIVRFLQKWHREDRAYYRRRAKLGEKEDTCPGDLK